MTSLFPIVVLISGQGSNLQAIIDHIQQGAPLQICAVISNRADAYGLQRAQAANIPTHIVSHKDFTEREDFEQTLRAIIDQYQPKLVVLAGFMLFLGSAFVNHFLGRMINIHPSLLPKYKGLNTHQRVIAAGDPLHGISIHFVTDDLDGGPIICQATLKVHVDDTAETLKQRVQAIEHRIYPQVIDWFAENRLKLRDDQVEFDGKLLPDSGILIT